MTTDPIPSNAIGIGLRGEHYEEATSKPHPVDWFEVHPENYFGLGGAPHAYLTLVRQDYPLSFHGVGLSLGSTDPLSESHLQKLKKLIDEYQPSLVSEHLSWSSFDGVYLHDLLPMPMTQESASHFINRIKQVQDYLGRQILVENASTYLGYTHSEMHEWEFINQIAQQSDCGLLVDVNNVYVNACNHGFDAAHYIAQVESKYVREMHLAGHTVKQLPVGEIRIDTHDQRVCTEVWELYRYACTLFTNAPTLIEWDKDLPEFSVLLDEADIARKFIKETRRAAA